MSAPTWQNTIQSTQAFIQSRIATYAPSYSEDRDRAQERTPVVYRTPFQALTTNGLIGLSRMASGPASAPDHSSTSNKDTLAHTTSDANKEALLRETTQRSHTDKIVNTTVATKSSESNSDPPTVPFPEWKQKLTAKNDDVKREINKLCDDSLNKAIAKIEKMPEEKRSVAAEQYISTYDYIMGGMKKVVDFSVGLGKYF